MTVDPGHHDDRAIDWQALEASPEFAELVRRKRRFVVDQQQPRLRHSNSSLALGVHSILPRRSRM